MLTLKIYIKITIYKSKQAFESINSFKNLKKNVLKQTLITYLHSNQIKHH